MMKRKIDEFFFSSRSLCVSRCACPPRTLSIGLIERNGIFHEIIRDASTHSIDVLREADEGQLVLLDLEEYATASETTRVGVELAHVRVPRFTCETPFIVLVQHDRAHSNVVSENVEDAIASVARQPVEHELVMRVHCRVVVGNLAQTVDIRRW